MSCIFESNLRNNPMYNRHILREEFGDKPFMPEDPTDGKPEESDEAGLYDEQSPDDFVDDEAIVNDEEAEDDNLPPDCERVEDVPDWAVNYLMYGDDSGLDEEDLEEVDAWMKANGYSDLVDTEEGTENEFCSYPAFGKACATVTAIMHKNNTASEEEPEESLPSDDEEDSLRMESCVMGSNLFGRGGYGKAILRHLDEEFGDDYYDREEEGDLSDGMGAEQTVGDRISSEFEGSEELINSAINFMEDEGYSVEDPADSVDESVWQRMHDTLIPSSPMEEDPVAELNAASDYYDGPPNEVDEPTTESYELHSMLTVEGEPTYEEPEVKKEPKPKAPTLTAKRNRRLRSKSRNIQLWNNKKKCFDPKYANTRFTRMSDANEAIKKISGQQ